MKDSKPLMPSKPLLKNPGVWRGSELQKSQEWIFHFPLEGIAEIENAMRRVQAMKLAPPNFGREDFPLPTFSTELNNVLEELEHGRGFLLMRGLPTECYSEAEAEIIFWGLSQHLGVPLSQNSEGHFLGHVRNLALDLNKTNVRGYQTTAELTFHNDQSDVLLLMCLNAAKSGGLSRIVSVTALQNEIQLRRPDLLDELYKPYYFDRRGERGRTDEDDLPYFAMPVLSYHGGLVSARYSRGYIQSAQRFPEVPRLTDKQIEALDLFDAIAKEEGMELAFQMEPGDIQLLNNYSVLHARTDFEDFPEPERRRHLLRLWLSVPNSRELPPCFEKRFGTCRSGAVRGGIPPSADVIGKIEEFRLERT